jgi:DegV family protein with EDD domain
VLRDWAHDVDVRSREVQDFAVLLEGALGSARRSLERTPEHLAVLRDAGVVDAGAQGFLYLLEGVADLIAQGERARVATAALPEQPAETMHAVPQAPPPRRFCTECVVVGEGLDRPAVRGAFAHLGESLMVGGSDRRARVHIHSDDPRQVFDTALRFGRVEREKVDDLRQQWIDAFGDVARDVAIVTDSTCDLPAELIEAYNIHVVPVRINTGARQYIDKVTITPESFGPTMAEAPEHPKTAPPPPGDFRRAYEWITRHYKSAVSIHLAGQLTTTCQVASSAAQSVSDRITVIDGRSASVGLGLVVIEAARAARDGLDHAAVVRRAEDAIRRLRVLFSVPSTEYLVRGGRISPMKGLLSRLARVQPILTFDPAGRLEPAAMAAMGQDVAAKTMALVTRDAARRRNLRFAVGHAGAPAVASWYVEQVRARFGCDDVVVADISPALTCHAGPATAGIAWLGD